MALAAPALMLNQEEDVDKRLTNEIFSILENKFLFGYHHDDRAPARGKVRILSIDAGGDAILAARTLLHFQSILRRKSGNPSAHIADFFDVVTGAGAGGILAGLLFTRAKDSGGPLLTAEDSLQFIVDNSRKLFPPSSSGLFRRRASKKAVLMKVFGDLTLKDTVKAVLIPCYDLRTGAPFLFSRADALEVDGCDFSMAGVCGATVADDRAMELKSVEGTRKIVAVGGGVGMSNPTAAAITHVLNNKQEFPLCRGVEDLLVVSLGNCCCLSDPSNSSPAQIAADGAADMVDQAVSMAFGEWRRSNYVRIQGNGMLVSSALNKKRNNNIMSIVDEMLGQKNVESILFQGKKLVEFTNMEKLEMLAGEVIKEQHRRNNNCVLPNVVLKQSSMNNIYSPRRSSSATTLSTISSC